MNLVCNPGSMGLAVAAANCFGIDNVDAGDWRQPVIVQNVSNDDAEAFAELLAGLVEVESTSLSQQGENWILDLNFNA